jgi:hypothetical protein
MGSASIVETLAGEILDEGLDDWVPLLSVSGRARARLPHRGGDTRRQPGGDQGARGRPPRRGWRGIDGGFFEWDEDLDAALARIREVWETTDSNDWGFVAWISNTPAGDETAIGGSGVVR